MKQAGMFGDDEEPEKPKGWDTFDSEESERARDRDIERVTSTDAAEEWRVAAYPVAAALCRQRRELTTDDIWRALQDAGIAPPPEKRAMTGITAGLAKAGLLENTGRVLRTERVARHRGYCTVWKSLVGPP